MDSYQYLFRPRLRPRNIADFQHLRPTRTRYNYRPHGKKLCLFNAKLQLRLHHPPSAARTWVADRPGFLDTARWTALRILHVLLLSSTAFPHPHRLNGLTVTLGPPHNQVNECSFIFQAPSNMRPMAAQLGARRSHPFFTPADTRSTTRRGISRKI